MANRTFLDADGSFLKSIVTDESDPDRVIHHSVQDLESTFKQIEFLKDEPMDPEFKCAAVIPGAIVEQMMRDGSWNDPAAIKRWLNDPQNQCFRVWKGRV